MTFRQFAFNNVFRNKRIYAAYFLSSLFSVLVFFVYAIFAFHPGLAKINPNVSVGLHFAEAIIYVFSFIFVLISMSAFLNSRKKEFGLMVMLGMTNQQLRLMVFLENVLIGFSATVSGIAIGLVFAKLILMAAESLLSLEETLPFYLPWQAMLLTFSAFLILFIVISFFTVSILKGNKLIDLIKGSTAPKKEPKASIILSILAALLLAVGYTIALVVHELQVVIAMIPVTILVIIGTYFLFTQLSVFTINRLKKRKSIFWKKTNLVLLSDLAYRMKDNARAFFFVAIVSTVAFSAIGTLVGFRYMFTASLTEGRPFAFEYVSNQGNQEENKHIQLIEKELTSTNYKKASITIKHVSVETPDGESVEWGIVSQSEYNHLAEIAGQMDKEVTLQENETILLYFQNALAERPDMQEKISYQIGGQTVQQKAIQSMNLIGTQEDYLVVNDEVYKQIKDFTAQTYYGFYLKDWKDTVDIGKNILKTMGLEQTGGYSPDGQFRFSSLGYDWNNMNQGFGAILFIGLFIGAVFFVAAGSFLYFRLYADLGDEKQKFSAIGKIGLTDKELSKILTIQLALLFFVPIIVAVIHGAVALTALQHMFNFNLFKSSAAVLGTFTAIQLIYFLFIRFNYIRKIKESI
ncbi:ABC transporter permease [Lederbergia sp. NSJ-179]|uniref:ABC transporter permease n=1 Tax=Lederbergia sp. NSJ-179 TaxID=2931402 RepID=UPI001FD3BFBF|nr:ABC transporter permease [Lederbergia sp. NSJ-179]MCJ7840143.1 ABC transporter permease [Lederbergia sp. NSJ-179]